MALSILYLLWLDLVLAAPSYVPGRSTDISVRDLANGLLNTTSAVSITDHNGLDITSSFQIMVYSGTLPSNLSRNGLQNRQTGRITYINDCLPDSPSTESLRDAFKESKCTPRSRMPGSLQRWTKTCYKFITHYNNQGIPSSSSLIEYYLDGHCRFEEVCLNTFAPPIYGRRGPQIAMCVAKADFEPPLDRSKSGIKRLIDAVLDTMKSSHSSSKSAKLESSDGSDDSKKESSESLGQSSNSSATLSVSQADGQTPLAVDTLKLAAWNGDEGQVSDASPPQSYKCKDCMDLEVANLPLDTSHLKLEAKMLTAGAMAGIMWVAMMSG